MKSEEVYFSGYGFELQFLYKIMFNTDGYEVVPPLPSAASLLYDSHHNVGGTVLVQL